VEFPAGMELSGVWILHRRSFPSRDYPQIEKADFPALLEKQLEIE